MIRLYTSGMKRMNDVFWARVQSETSTQLVITVYHDILNSVDGKLFNVWRAIYEKRI